MSHVSKVDPSLTLLLAARRACVVCGYVVEPGEPMYRVWDDSDATLVRHQATTGHGLVDDLTALGHLSCMLYSVLVCPHWRTPGARLGRDTDFTPGVARGARPSVFGFNGSMLMLDPQDVLRQLRGESNPLTVVHWGLVEEIPFGEPAEIEDRYVAACAADGDRSTGGRRFHGTPSVPGARPLQVEMTEVLRELRDPALAKHHMAYEVEGRRVPAVLVATPLGADLPQHLGLTASAAEPSARRPDNRAARRAQQRGARKGSVDR